VSTGSQLSLLPHPEKTAEIPLKPEGQIIVGDTLEELRKFPDETFQCCVTSPPIGDFAIMAYQARLVRR